MIQHLPQFALMHVVLQLCPLSRLSSLPELQAFVSLFRPKRIIPNTLVPDLMGPDWDAIPAMFAECISLPVLPSSVAPASTFPYDLDAVRESGLSRNKNQYTALLNVMGDGAQADAQRWANDGNVRSRLNVIRAHVGGASLAKADASLVLVHKGTRNTQSDHNEEAAGQESDDLSNKSLHDTMANSGQASQDTDCDDSSEQRERTAEALFGHIIAIDSGLWGDNPDVRLLEGNTKSRVRPPSAGDPLDRKPQGKRKRAESSNSTTPEHLSASRHTRKRSSV
jgi:DNA cross-link repair 1C protein